MGRSQRQRHRPTRDDIAVVSWLLSRRVWVGTVVFGTLLLASLAGLAALYFEADVLGSLRRAVEAPASALALFLAARALSLSVTQRYRDRQIEAGRRASGRDVSVVGMLTVASFATVGLVAAVVAFPMLVNVTGLYHVVAVGVVVLVVPVTFTIQVHQLTEKTSADRHSRGYRVSPAVWTFLWTLPAVLLVWFLVVGNPTASVYVPETIAGTTVSSSLTGRTVVVDAWGLAYAVISTPTVLVVLYTVRRTVSSGIRLLK